MIIYYMPMRQRDGQKEEAIYVATIQLLNEIGFADISVSKIARRADARRPGPGAFLSAAGWNRSFGAMWLSCLPIRIISGADYEFAAAGQMVPG